MLKGNWSERGDTLIEVLMAFSLLALVSVGVFSVMHRGVGEAYNSLERSQVRTYINEQTELANYLRDQYAVATANGDDTTEYPMSLWREIKTRATANATASLKAMDDCTSVMNGSFALVYDSGTFTYNLQNFTSANLSAASFATPGTGMWIEPVASTGTSVPYIDLYVKACWDPSNGNVKQTMSTVVRLYDK